jgi:hypothetical protein
MRARAVFLAALLVVAACGDDATTTPSTTTAAAAATTTAGTTTAPSVTTTAGPTTTTTVMWPAARGWVVGTSSGLVALDENGTRTTLVDGPVSTVAVGPDGTVFFQRASILFGRGETTTAADTRVLAYDRVTRSVRDVVVPARGADAWAGALQLDSVVIVGGRVQLLLRRSMFDPAQNVELQRWDEAFRRDVATGVETPGRRIAVWETTATRITSGGGLLVSTTRSEDARRGSVTDLDGTPVTRLAALVPAEHCSDATPACPDMLTISPSGARLAWVESPDAFSSGSRRWNLVVADVASATRLATVALPPSNAESVVAFAGDDRVVVSRFSWPDPATTMAVQPTSTVVDVRAGTATSLAVGGYAMPDVSR